mmetsp:Transcript_2168/g.6564  ORF Transcript_2168/g.6564 Transcript_2168/m.6564 type:complete len:298 (+) Transcript_2168:72-965(+)
MEAARALLDSLMGPSRDKERDKQKSGESFLDKNVCKYHLVGFCPTNHLDNYFRGKECAKRRVQECTLIHSDAARDEFERHPDHERYRAQYERDYLALLDSIVSEADAIVRREKPQARPLTPTVILKDTSSKEVQRWEEEIKELMKRSEELAEKGLVTESQECLTRARINQKQIDLKRQSYTYMCGEEVCDVCGLRFIVGDSREDKTNSETHRRSRMHTGYVLVREKAEEMREKLKRAPEPPAASKRPEEKQAERKRSRSRSRGRGCSRSRERCRSRSRKRRGRSASRKRRRGRSRGR